MKLLIDSQPTDFTASKATTFSGFCEELLELLLKKHLYIGSCTVDGEVVTSLPDGNKRFNAQSVVEVQTTPLQLFLKSALNHHCQEIDRIEAECNSLVTESLVGEPIAILEQWRRMCAGLKEQVLRAPSLCGLLHETDAEDLASQKFTRLSTIMRGCAESLSKADVVGFSDTLELELIPWLREFKKVIQLALANLEKIPEK